MRIRCVTSIAEVAHLTACSSPLSRPCLDLGRCLKHVDQCFYLVGFHLPEAVQY